MYSVNNEFFTIISGSSAPGFRISEFISGDNAIITVTILNMDPKYSVYRILVAINLTLVEWTWK